MNSAKNCSHFKGNIITKKFGLQNHFDVGATFEMRETNTEKSIFRLIMIAAAQRLIKGRR